MKLKTLLERCFQQPENKEEAIRRYRRIAGREAIASGIMLLVYFTVPVWAEGAEADQFSALFLAVSWLLAILAAATIWSAALLKRGIYY